ncbi:hypothetical protein [Streptomyces sp. NPDC059786]|uniref:hypothetical protein n=1 Tax=Streptomyces sp. NPDC059786 TaxID=3346946 RepID=UPI0036468DEA
MAYSFHRAHQARRACLDTATGLAARSGPRLLQISFGVVFLWFGLPKFVPHLSAMDGLATDTITALSHGAVTGESARVLLAVLETLIGLCLLFGRLLRMALAALLLQLVGTFTPLLLFPGRTWKSLLVPTLEGQFIIKNLILVSAAIVIGGGFHRATDRSHRDPGRSDVTAVSGRHPSAAPHFSARPGPLPRCTCRRNER